VDAVVKREGAWKFGDRWGWVSENKKRSDEGEDQYKKKEYI
jgi:hypothetical protein